MIDNLILYVLLLTTTIKITKIRALFELKKWSTA